MSYPPFLSVDIQRLAEGVYEVMSDQDKELARFGLLPSDLITMTVAEAKRKFRQIFGFSENQTVGDVFVDRDSTCADQADMQLGSTSVFENVDLDKIMSEFTRDLTVAVFKLVPDMVV